MFRETQPLLEPPLVIIFVNYAAIFCVFFFIIIDKEHSKPNNAGFFFPQAYDFVFV